MNLLLYYYYYTLMIFIIMFLITIQQDGVHRGYPKTSNETLVDHMVLLTGYATTSDGVNYFEFQNSYGSHWGNEGFGKLIRKSSRKKGEPSLISAYIYPEVRLNYMISLIFGVCNLTLYCFIKYLSVINILSFGIFYAASGLSQGRLIEEGSYLCVNKSF